MGISRASTVASAILMLLRGMTPNAALDSIQRVRCQANPNLGFLLALERFQAEAARFQVYRQVACSGGYSGPLSGLVKLWRQEGARPLSCASTELQDSPLMPHRTSDYLS
eukprot:Hpha_TRINITY_DN16039_c0_g1::TRINITY_DN16039_c0_g1_i1::g.119791::m.119791